MAVNKLWQYHNALLMIRGNDAKIYELMQMCIRIFRARVSLSPAFSE